MGLLSRLVSVVSTDMHTSTIQKEQIQKKKGGGGIKGKGHRLVLEIVETRFNLICYFLLFLLSLLSL